jgi:hypothetical protein
MVAEGDSEAATLVIRMTIDEFRVTNSEQLYGGKLCPGMVEDFKGSGNCQWV